MEILLFGILISLTITFCYMAVALPKEENV